MQTFRNPVSPFEAPDPFMTYDPVTEYYYALFTRGTKLELFRSRHAGSIVTDGDSRIIYTPNGERDGIWGDIWAPEMHRGSNGKWYIYTSGRIKPEPSEKRIFIMEGPSEDPFVGEWLCRCGLATYIPELQAEVDLLTNAIDENGICRATVDENQLKGISTYGGQQLEVDWKTDTRKLCDVTFRVLLIMHYANGGKYEL